VCVSDDDDNANNTPVYEVPPLKYSAEYVIKLLLNPNIDKSKICHERPLKITESATYIVDLNSLLDENDIKKDNFGVWHHCVLHTLKFECCITADGVTIGSNATTQSVGTFAQYSLRRLHCKHPTNKNVKRLICFITGKVN
jgi:hypothetical protein